FRQWARIAATLRWQLAILIQRGDEWFSVLKERLAIKEHDDAFARRTHLDHLFLTTFAVIQPRQAAIYDRQQANAAAGIAGDLMHPYLEVINTDRFALRTAAAAGRTLRTTAAAHRRAAAGLAG